MRPQCLPATLLAAALGCADEPPAPAAPVTLVEGTCQVADATMAPDSLAEVRCAADFQALASAPVDATLPGARSVKVIYDTFDSTLYFQHSTRFQIHHQFASMRLSGGARPVVPALAQFNTTEYFRPDRRFLLGAVTYYESARVWALELSPYDTASGAMIATLFNAVKARAYFGPALAFHPTSDAVATAGTMAGVRQVTTNQIYASIDYQPLTLGRGIGRLRFTTAAAIASQHLSYTDIVVMDEAPNDISVVRGLITQAFQTPLSHVNVLSQNRRTPNMGLRGAMTNRTLRALENKLVELNVTSARWTVREVTAAEAEAFWTTTRPAAITLPALDLSVTALTDLREVTPEPVAPATLREAIRASTRIYGGKAAQYSILTRTEGVPIRPGFAVPMYYYDQFMRANGFYARVDALLADADFRANAATREARLAALREAMMAGAVDPTFQDALRARIAAVLPTGKVRFRTSTNSEDLDGFPCSGCYDSHTGDPRDWNDVLDAIRETWSTLWSFRAFEERSYYSIDHRTLGMALLVHNNFPDEEANGVAVTNNPFDASGIDPAFYVNVQQGGDVEVVAPPPGVSSDQFLHYFYQPGQPVNYLAHSSLVRQGATVLTATQIRDLGTALNAIHQRFSPAYGPASGNTGWYAMDVEFKFDDDGAGGTARLFIKQARPYPGRGM